MTSTSLHLRWPAERFYWAVLDASQVSAVSGKLNQRLGYLFENFLPGVAIENVQAVYHPFSVQVANTWRAAYRDPFSIKKYPLTWSLFHQMNSRVSLSS